MARRILICALLIALSMALSFCAGRARDGHEAMWRGGSRLSSALSGGVSFDELRALRELIERDSYGAFAGWSEAASQQAEAEFSGGTASVDAIYVSGDASLVINAPLIAGRMPNDGDSLGCAIDEKTALKLFGSTDVLGKALNINGQEMEVCGVFALDNGGRGLALCPAAKAGEGAQVQALEFALWPEEGVEAADLAQTLLSEAGIGGAGAIDDHQSASEQMEWALALAAGALRAVVLIELIRRVKRIALSRLSEVQKSIATFLSWIAMAAALVALPGWIAPPKEFLPTQWSDFGFWPKLFDSWRDGARAMLLSGMSSLRLMELASTARVLVFCALSILVTLCAWRALRIASNQMDTIKGGTNL